MHLIGIQPSNSEQDWSSKSIRIFQKHIKKLENDFQNILYDARVIFSLRGAFVVDKIRAADTINLISHLRFEKELVDKKLGIPCQGVVAQVKRIAKEAGVNFEKKIEPMVDSVTDTKPTEVKEVVKYESSKESATLNLPAKLNSSVKADVEKDLIEFPICSNAEMEPWDQLPTEEEFTEKWTKPPSIKRGRIFITNFYSPDNFYINYDTNE